MSHDIDPIISKVEACIRAYQSDHEDCPDILVQSEQARRDGEWYYVAVTSPNRPARSYMYYDMLQEIEMKLFQEHHLKVLLVPALLAA